MNFDYSQFLSLRFEIGLTAILVIAFFADILSGKQRERRWFNPLICILMLVHLIANLWPTADEVAFGGMYITNPGISTVKTILNLGTLIVLVQSREWLQRPDTRFKEGEFYMLTISTLLGMNMLVSANHFLLFYLALEMAGMPMACLVAFDKYRHNSAEAGAKFILTAVFASAIMLYGISFVYGAVGTMYFDDISVQLTSSPLAMLGLAFFFCGLGFEISLVPFHFWTADTYQGAPTTVTGYMSVVSKGASASTLAAILIKVFAPMAMYWQYLLCVVIVVTITVANLFAIRQKDLKRFMAFSSISQAGYIMLATVGDNDMSMSSLAYYILIYVVANLAVFTIISAIEEHNNGATDMDDYNGLYKTNPRLTLVMTLALFSLGGIPPFAGMFSKFFVFMAALKGATLDNPLGITTYITVFIALINTVVSLYYYLLIVKAMYIKPNETPLPTFKSNIGTTIALAICLVGILLFGICSGVYDWVNCASTLPV